MKKSVYFLLVLACVGLTACSGANSPVGFVLDLLSKEEETEPETVEDDFWETRTEDEGEEDFYGDEMTAAVSEDEEVMIEVEHWMVKDEAVDAYLAENPTDDNLTLMQYWLDGESVLCVHMRDSNDYDIMFQYEPVTKRLCDTRDIDVSVEVPVLEENNNLFVNSLGDLETCLAGYAIRYDYRSITLVDIQGSQASLICDGNELSVRVGPGELYGWLTASKDFMQLPREFCYILGVYNYYASNGFADKMDTVQVNYTRANMYFMSGCVERNGIEWCMCITYDGSIFSGRNDVTYENHDDESNLLTESLQCWSAFMGNRNPIRVIRQDNESVTIKFGEDEDERILVKELRIDTNVYPDKLAMRYAIQWDGEEVSDIVRYLDSSLQKAFVTGYVSVSVKDAENQVYNVLYGNTDYDLKIVDGTVRKVGQ